MPRVLRFAVPEPRVRVPTSNPASTNPATALPQAASLPIARARKHRYGKCHTALNGWRGPTWRMSSETELMQTRVASGRYYWTPSSTCTTRYLIKHAAGKSPKNPDVCRTMAPCCWQLTTRVSIAKSTASQHGDSTVCSSFLHLLHNFITMQLIRCDGMLRLELWYVVDAMLLHFGLCRFGAVSCGHSPRPK